MTQTLRPKYPIFGQDIKIMGLRDGNNITLTVACAMVDRHCAGITGISNYRDLLPGEDHGSVAKKFTNRHVDVHVNTADDVDNGSVFLTVTGTRQRWVTTVRWAGATGATALSPPTAR